MRGVGRTGGRTGARVGAAGALGGGVVGAVAVAVAAATGAAAGCVRVATPLEPPRVTVREVALDWTAAGLAARVDADVANVTARTLRLLAVDWTISADDRPLARGRAELGATVPARGATRVAIEAAVAPGQAAWMRERIGPGEAVLTVEGVLHFAAPGGRGVTARFAADVTWRAQDAPGGGAGSGRGEGGVSPSASAAR